MTAQPNILFFFPDQHRGDWTGYRGAPGVRTPFLDALASAGAVYTRALTPSPLCLPARACLASGKRYDDQPVQTNQDDFDLGAFNIYRAMREAGYHVMGCGKFDLLKDSMDWGRNGQHGEGEASRLFALGFSDGVDSAGKHDCITAFKRQRGDEPYRAFLMARGLWETHVEDFEGRSYPSECYTNTSPTPLPDDAYCDNWIAARGRSLIESAPAGKPWFLQVNFNGPHEPLDVTAGMQARWRDVELPTATANNQYSVDEHQDMRRNYAAMIENIDAKVGEFLALLDRLDQRERTLIVYSSDHGDNLGDHNKWHKTTPHQASVSVPLVLAGKGIARQHSAVPVDLVDVAATFLAASGASGSTDGASLAGGPPDRQALTSGFGEWRLIQDRQYKYIHGYDPSLGTAARFGRPFSPLADAPRQLYDLEADPMETENLAARDPGRCEAMRAALVALTGHR